MQIAQGCLRDSQTQFFPSSHNAKINGLNKHCDETNEHSKNANLELIKSERKKKKFVD